MPTGPFPKQLVQAFLVEQAYCAQRGCPCSRALVCVSELVGGWFLGKGSIAVPVVLGHGWHT